MGGPRKYTGRKFWCWKFWSSGYSAALNAYFIKLLWPPNFMLLNCQVWTFLTVYFESRPDTVDRTAINVEKINGLTKWMVWESGRSWVDVNGRSDPRKFDFGFWPPTYTEDLLILCFWDVQFRRRFIIKSLYFWDFHFFNCNLVQSIWSWLKMDGRNGSCEQGC